MDFKWKKFENTNARFEDRITVTASNSFGFPTKFYKDNNLDQYKYAIIFYDESQKAVGINFTNDDVEKHKFTILKSKQGYGANLIATSFFKTNNIDAKKYHGRYKWEKTEVSGVGTLYVILLKERPIILSPVQPDSTQPVDSSPIPEVKSVNSTDGGVPEGSTG